MRASLALVLQLCYFVYCQCNYTNPSTGLYYDLSPLTRQGNSADWSYQTKDGTYYINFCAPTQISCASTARTPTGVCQYYSFSKSQPWGSTNYVFSPYPTGVLQKDGVTLSYGAGVLECALGTPTTVEIRAICASVNGRVDAVTLVVPCHLVVEFSSKYACGTNLNSRSATPTPVPLRSASPTPSPIRSNFTTTPQYPLLAGIRDAVGTGYNIFSLSQTSYQIFDNWTYSENNIWQMEGSYNFPDQTRVSSESSYSMHSYVYESLNTYVNSLSNQLSVSVSTRKYGIKVGVTAGLERLETQMEAHAGVLAAATMKVPLYNVQMLPNMRLSNSFVYDVEQLPTIYDSSNPTTVNKFAQFLNKYGTHVQTGVTMGGEITALGIINGTQSASYSNLAVQLQLKLSMLTVLNIDTSKWPYFGMNKNPSNSKTWRFTPQVNGGTANIHNVNWYYSWIDTLPNSPAVIDRKILTIDAYIAEISPSAANAYMNYLRDFSNNQTDFTYTAPPSLIKIALKSNQVVVSPSLNTMPLAAVSLWGGDDEECYKGAVISVDDDSQTRSESAEPFGISWKTLKTFGTQPYGTTLADNELDEQTVANPLPTQWSVIDNRAWIPGLNSLGTGFDLPTGQTRLPIFDWTFSSSNYFTFPNTSQKYYYPNEVAFSPQSKIRTFNQAYYSSKQAYLHENSTDSSGFFLYGSDSQQVESIFSGGQSILAVYFELHALYQMTIKTPQLSHEFLEAVSNLPEDYDELIYTSFVHNWGSHVITGAYYGGAARLMSAVDQEYYSSYSSSQITSSLGFQYSGYELGIGWGTASSSSWASFSGESFQWLNFQGGNGPAALTSQWQEWLDSLWEAPAQVYQTYSKISSYVSDPTKAANVNRAITEMFHYPQFRKPLDPTMEISSNTNGKGISLPTKYSRTCSYSHGFGGVYDETLVTSVGNTYWNWDSTSSQYYTPPQLTDSDCAPVNVSLSNDINLLRCPSGKVIKYFTGAYYACNHQTSGTCSSSTLYVTGNPAVCCSISCIQPHN